MKSKQLRLRQQELQEIEKQKQRDVDRKLKRSGAAESSSSAPYVPPTPTARTSPTNLADPEEYREAQAAEARAFRELELKALERCKQRDAEREAKRPIGDAALESKPYVPPVARTLLQSRFPADGTGKQSNFMPPTFATLG